MQFVDFQIRAWLETEGRARVLVHSSPAGEMRRPVFVPMIPEAVERLREQFGHHYWVSGDPTVRTKTIELGQQLSQTLLPPPVFLLMLRSLDRLGPGQGLRLRLCLDPSLTDAPGNSSIART